MCNFAIRDAYNMAVWRLATRSYAYVRIKDSGFGACADRDFGYGYGCSMDVDIRQNVLYSKNSATNTSSKWDHPSNK